jgi:alkyl hydroperoxide reductase subunit F
MKCNHDIKEIIVVGAGPAGITAAIYAARQKRCIWVFYETLGGQATLTDDIENYSGFRMISGADFAFKLKDHLDEYDLQPMEEKVREVTRKGELFEVETNKGLYKSRAVIIATGARHKALNIEGEKEFTGKGVAYCSICDAPLFNRKDVAVIGGGNSALTTALELEKYANKEYLVTLNEEMYGDQILVDKIKSSSKIEFICCSKIKKINGDKFVRSIDIETGRTPRTINVQGVFVEIGYVANSEIIDVKKNEKGEVMINERNETSIPGAFAAGDVSNTKVKQILVAAAEGAKAALSASEYISRLSK